jgi:hypothetical protein
MTAVRMADYWVDYWAVLGSLECLRTDKGEL